MPPHMGGVGMLPMPGMPGMVPGMMPGMPNMQNMYQARPGEINPVLAKQQAEMIAKIKAQQMDAQAATQAVTESQDANRKRQMSDLHAAASDGGKRRKRRWGDESDKANVTAVISQDLTPDQQKA